MAKLSKKRKILAASLAIAMVSAISVNWYYNEKIDTHTDEGTTITQSVNLGDSIYVNGKAENSEKTKEKENEKDSKEGEAKETAETTVGSAEYFAQAQLKRTQTHDETLDKISGMLDSGNSTEAQKLLESYTEALKVETDIENLIKAKINCECLAVINENQAQIVVESDALDDLYLLQITDIVTKQTNISPENIIIIQAK